VQSEILPTLDELSRDPARAENLPRQAIAALTAQATAALGALASAMMRDATSTARDEPPDRTLDANALAEALGLSRRTLFRTVERFPFIKRTSRRSLAARERDVNRWLKARRA
jgi:predicted DNA-binding transcriptional regulator AlpA